MLDSSVEYERFELLFVRIPACGNLQSESCPLTSRRRVNGVNLLRRFGLSLQPLLLTSGGASAHSFIGRRSNSLNGVRDANSPRRHASSSSTTHIHQSQHGAGQLHTRTAGLDAQCGGGTATLKFEPQRSPIRNQSASASDLLSPLRR